MFSSCIYTDLIITLAILSAIVIGYYKWSFQYWRKKNVPYLKPEIPFGNIADTICSRRNEGIVVKDIYMEMKKKGWNHGGIYVFSSPYYLTINLDYIKNVMAKDFQHFTDRLSYYNEKEDPLNAHLVTVGGSRWYNLRTKLSPTFTSGKIKMMFQTVEESQGFLLNRLEEESGSGKPVDIKNILERFAIDVIGSCAFGLEIKSITHEDCPFKFYGRKMFSGTKFMRFKRTLAATFPNLALFLNISITAKDITDFFMNLVKDTIWYREKNNFRRNDFLQLLIDLKNQTDNLSLTEIAAQCFVFFLAGYETSSSVMSFICYELARNPDIQTKLREEINSVLKKHDWKMTYESVQDMTYLSQVIDETLRMYPPIPVVERKCVRDYKIPGEEVTIEKGTPVIIPILGVHYDEEFYPNPEKFDPERFSKELKNSRPSYAYMPFGEGPRICIGMRFAQLEVKLAICSLIKNYKFSVNGKTKEPLEMDASRTLFGVVGDIWLNIEKV